MENNLIKKLQEKLKASKNKIASIALAGTLALSGIGLTSCSNGNESNNNSTNSSQTQNSTESSQSGNSQSSSEKDYSKFSNILKAVLTDEYYRDLIITDIATSTQGQNANSYKSARYNAIPYGFLEDEGYDIEKIKNSQLGSSANLYTIGNDLFIELRVETKSSINYYTHYVLKYNLTDQELKELDSLFVPISNNKYSTRTTYYQAPFFIQELSYQKEAEVVSEAYITADAIKAVEQYFDRYGYNSSTNTVTYLNTNIFGQLTQATLHTFQTHTFVDNTYTSSLINLNGKLNTMKLYTNGSGCTVVDNKYVYSDKSNPFIESDDLIEEYNASTQNINLYTCENCNFLDINTEELSTELSK